MPADDAYSAGPGASLASQPAGGVIYDRGYRRDDGVRLGRLQIVLALFWHSLRSSFGIGRGAKAKILPVITFVALCLPAVVNAVAVAKGGPPVVFYGTYTFPLRVVVMTIFVAVQAPELVSRDLRSHVLPLYFSRPLRRGDYPAAKYAAFTVACLLMIELPLLLLYLGTIISANGGSGVWHQTRLLAGGLGVGALWAVLLAAIGLALACLSAKRAYATGAVAIFFYLDAGPDHLLGRRAPGHGAPGRRASAPARRGRDHRHGHHLGPAAGRPDQPVHGAGRRQAVARRQGPGADGPTRPLRSHLRRDVPGTARGESDHPRRPVPEGGCGMTTIELADVSRWYGNVVAVNEVTMTIGPGVTGLLGPNGAGKSTIIHMISGFLEPSRGKLTIGGAASWDNPDIYRTLGLVPEQDSVYAFLTGGDFVRATARLQQLTDVDGVARRVIDMVEMAEAADRRISTYSKGMRQRIKVAAALVHDPEVLLLDEPFNGMDPRQRLHMMDLLDKLGAEGRTILFSSHILEEVERLSGTIQVIVAGRLAASGDFRAIRRLMTSRPHVFTVRSTDDRLLGATLIGRSAVSGVEVTASGLQVRASDYGAFCREIAVLARRHDIRLLELLPDDESLESVFAYLVAS
jgi:ABC-2 type transport system ATP-binding protein